MKNGYTWLQQNRIKSFYKIVEGLGLEKGGSALMQSVGVGKLAPNIVLLGYKTDWVYGNCNELQEYFNLLQWVRANSRGYFWNYQNDEWGVRNNFFYFSNILDNRLAVAILRVNDKGAQGNVNFVNDEENLDIGFDSFGNNTFPHTNSDSSMNSATSRIQTISQDIRSPSVASKESSPKQEWKSVGERMKNKRIKIVDKLLQWVIGNKTRKDFILLTGGIFFYHRDKKKELPTTLEYKTIFQRKHKNGIIDVWWLYDDGGKYNFEMDKKR